jgi:pimeloyl-ACP methyl ester carboxylesterase
MFQSDPDELQALVDSKVRTIDVPCLAVFGRPISAGDRERVGWLSDIQLDEWLGAGHFVHLVEPERFATRLLKFVQHCSS